MKCEDGDELKVAYAKISRRIYLKVGHTTPTFTWRD
jgi:hypothetical protein